MKKIIAIILILAFVLVAVINNSAQTDPNDFTKVLPQYKGNPTKLYGDGVHDDTEALNNWGKGKTVYFNGKKLGRFLEKGTFLVTWRVDFNRRNSIVRDNTFVWKYTGFDNSNWFGYGRRVKHYRNKVIDVGIDDSPFLKEYEKKRKKFWKSIIPMLLAPPISLVRIK